MDGQINKMDGVYVYGCLCVDVYICTGPDGVYVDVCLCVDVYTCTGPDGVYVYVCLCVDVYNICTGPGVSGGGESGEGGGEGDAEV